MRPISFGQYPATANYQAQAIEKLNNAKAAFQGVDDEETDAPPLKSIAVGLWDLSGAVSAIYTDLKAENAQLKEALTEISQRTERIYRNTRRV